jgi:hypothetical protein
VESQNIPAGGEVTGVIHLHLQIPIQADSLALEFSGKEHCYWEKTTSSRNSDGSSSETTYTYQETSTIIEQLFLIHEFQYAHVAAGVSSYPFKFVTSTNLPGSFQYEFDRAKAHIKYYLSAYIRTPSSDVKKGTVEIEIRRRMMESIVSLQGAVSAEIFTCCCLRQGMARLSATINKSAYMPGEVCCVSVKVDNSRSLLDVVRLKLTLFRTIRLRAEYSHHLMQDEIAEAYDYHRIPVGQAVSGPDSILMSLIVQDPKGTVQSTGTLLGKHIECVYTVVVQAVMDGCFMCCGDTPEIKKEVTIYPPQLHEMEVPQPSIG